MAFEDYTHLIVIRSNLIKDLIDKFVREFEM